MWLLISVALAGDPVEIEGALGFESSAASSLHIRRGPRLQVAVRPNRVLGVAGAVSLYPHAGERDWTASITELVQQNELSPTLTRELGQALVGVEVTPLQTRSEGRSAALRLSLLGGGVLTEDDLALSQLESDRAATRVQNQLHPTWGWSVSTEVAGRVLGIRGRYAQTRYLEEFALVRSLTIERVWLGAEVVVRWNPTTARG